MEYGKSMAGYRQGPIYSKLWLKGTNDPTTLHMMHCACTACLACLEAPSR